MNEKSMPLESYIEALLFYNVGPMSVEELAYMLETDRARIEEALQKLRESLRKRGVRLVEQDENVRLATMPGAGEIIEKMREEDLSRGLGKAGLETLALILYKGPVSKARIDYVRGVNAASVLRTLLAKGLVEKIKDPNDARITLYKATVEALQYLGVEKREDLPDYQTIQSKIERFEKQGSDTEDSLTT